MERQRENGENMSTRCTAILLAAGRGSRMGGGTRKQYLNLNGAPLFTYAAKSLGNSERITDIVVVVPESDIEQVRLILEEQGAADKVRKIVAGGSERYFSVLNGLRAIDWSCDYVFIHDGARPFIDGDSIERLYQTVVKEKACVAGMPSKDTVKITDEAGYVVSTPNRSNVWIIQTPQVFARDLITEAYEKLAVSLDDLTRKGIAVTDDAMVAEHLIGCKVKLVEASYSNIKITTPEDLPIAEALCRR